MKKGVREVLSAHPEITSTRKSLRSGISSENCSKTLKKIHLS